MVENRGALIAGIVLFIIAVVILMAVAVIPALTNATDTSWLWTTGLVI
jgi:hypothetical protein